MERHPSNPLTVNNSSCLWDFLNWTRFLDVLMVFSVTDFFFSFPVNSGKLSVSKTPRIREFHTLTTQRDPTFVRNSLVLWVLNPKFLGFAVECFLLLQMGFKGKIFPEFRGFFHLAVFFYFIVPRSFEF